MKRVTFQQHFGLWSAGDTAGFDAETAQKLTDAGLATLLLDLPVTAEIPAPAVPTDGQGETPSRALTAAVEKPTRKRGKT